MNNTKKKYHQIRTYLILILNKNLIESKFLLFEIFKNATKKNNLSNFEYVKIVLLLFD